MLDREAAAGSAAKRLRDADSGRDRSAARRLIVALDAAPSAKREALVERLGDSVTFYKIGMELIYGGGGLALGQAR